MNHLDDEYLFCALEALPSRERIICHGDVNRVSGKVLPLSGLRNDDLLCVSSVNVANDVQISVEFHGSP